MDMDTAKTLIVGDIHGCYEELRTLVAAAGLDPGDRLVAVGDVAGRGPESDRVLSFLMDRPNTSCLMGNHEWKHVQGHNGLSHRIVRQQCGPDLYARALDWMRDLPLWLELEDLIVVHWGLEPSLALVDQDPAVLMGLPAGEQRLAAVLGGRAWYDVYPGPRKVVYGHHSWAAGIRRGLTFGIDTGCVYGQELTGLLLPDLRLVKVPAREDHWARLQREWGGV